jgi:hypothetical protein
MTITVILGPAPCQGCDRLVVWGTAVLRGSSGTVRRWRDPETGRSHRCKRET